MKTRIVRIGNSQGIRIPKLLLEQTGLKGEVEISVKDQSLVVRAAKLSRENWADAFKDMTRLGDDDLVDAADKPLSSWDEDGWEWP